MDEMDDICDSRVVYYLDGVLPCIRRSRAHARFLERVLRHSTTCIHDAIILGIDCRNPSNVSHT